MNKIIYTEKLFKKIEEKREEFNLHLFMLMDFKKKVDENMEKDREGSPLMRLKKIDSPLSKKTKATISHMYERLDNAEIISRLNKTENELINYINMIDTIKECWNEILELTKINSASDIMKKMKLTRKKILSLEISLQEAFFVSDDITRGILKKGIHLKYNVNDLLIKLIDILSRTLLKGSLNFRKSDEQKNVDVILLRLNELNLFNNQQVQLFLDVKILLDIEPISPSEDICYKKFGEMHSNIHSKMFLLKSLNHLRKYFSDETIYSFDILTNHLQEIHKELSLDDENGKEIEIHIKILEDLLMESNPGKEYFLLNNKLHKQHLLLSSRYHKLDVKNLQKCIEILSRDTFKSFILECQKCIFNLRNEKKNKKASIDDLLKLGMATGKTVMIDTYEKAIDEILASLGTFLANTLHSLLQEILVNIPKDDNRSSLEELYKISELVLHELNHI